ncbi:MAG: TetR/AcrR family transcriptional regulator [Myxococcota bacterium]
MPSTTFENLAPEKRERFVLEARDEFARCPYDQASITAIVKRLGIAKGSVYQYFDDKLDLFAWLVGEAGRRKVAGLGSVAPAGGDPYALLRAAYRDGLRYWLAEPEWSRLALRVLEPSVDAGVSRLRRSQEAAVHAWLEQWLAEGQRTGAVRRDLPVADGARLVRGLLSEGLLSAFLGRLGTDADAFLEAPSDLPAHAVAEALGVADVAVDLLERALRP